MLTKGIYQNGISAQSFECDVTLEGDSIEIYLTSDSTKKINWNIATIKSCQGNETGLLITHGNYPHETLECSGELAKSIFQNWSKNSISRKTEGFFFTKNKFTVIKLCFVFVAFCLFGYFYVLPWAGEKASGFIPKSLEEEMGEELSNVFTNQYTSIDSASYFVQQFTNELHLDSIYKIEVQVLETEDINAFALPGGKLFIYSGILKKMKTPEELAALLGHEITHVNNRHSLKNICRSLAGTYIISAMFGDVTGISSGVLMQADEFKQLDYSRDLETEADLNGLELMVRNKISPKGMKDLLELLQEEGDKMPELMKYLSTHPETEARIKRVITNPNYQFKFSTNARLKNLFEGIQRSL